METSRLAPAAMPERAVVAITKMMMLFPIGKTSLRDFCLPRHNYRPQQEEKREHLQHRSNRMEACEAVQLHGQECFVIWRMLETEHDGCRPAGGKRVQNTQQRSKGQQQCHLCPCMEKEGEEG